MVLLIILAGGDRESQSRVGRKDKVDGDGEAEVILRDYGRSRTVHHRRGGNSGLHIGLLIEHREVDGVEVDSLRAGKFLLLGNLRRDLAVRSIDVSGNFELAI